MFNLSSSTTKLHVTSKSLKVLVPIAILVLFLSMVSSVKNSSNSYFSSFRGLLQAISTTEWVCNFASYIQIPNIPYYDGSFGVVINSLSGLVNLLTGIINSLSYAIQFVLNICLYVINLIISIFTIIL